MFTFQMCPKFSLTPIRLKQVSVVDEFSDSMKPRRRILTCLLLVGSNLYFYALSSPNQHLILERRSWSFCFFFSFFCSFFNTSILEPLSKFINHCPTSSITWEWGCRACVWIGFFLNMNIATYLTGSGFNIAKKGRWITVTTWCKCTHTK